MPLFSADTTMFSKKNFFSLTARSAQTAQIEEFMFQNVAYRPTVYRTGIKGVIIEYVKPPNKL